MSLFWHKRAIARAVLGELPAADEARLRAHLGACATCRAHYDELSRTAQAVGGGAGPAARERARLFAALDAPAGPTPAVSPAPRRRPLLGIALAVSSVTAILAWRNLPPDAPSPTAADDVTLRGGAEPAVPGSPATIVVYASRKTGPKSHGPLRLAGELPGSGEVRVSLGDFLQLGVRGVRAPAHVRVVGVDEEGVVHDYVRDTKLVPTREVWFGNGTVELAHEHTPGRVRVIALFSNAKVQEQAVRDAIARLDLRRADRAVDATPGVVGGLLVIEP